MTKLDYPAITICKEKGLYDPGEYIRPVFNQFQFACSYGDKLCDETALLKDHYQNFIGVSWGLEYNYSVGRPIIRKVSKIRIWVVPPVCLGSR